MLATENTNIDGLNQDWGKYKTKFGQLWGGKNRQLGTQLSSQFICVSHPTVCDINRISNLAMNYFYILNLCSHIPYVAITATSNNSLLIFKMLPINITQSRGHWRDFQVNSLFSIIWSRTLSLVFICIKLKLSGHLVTDPGVAFAFIVSFLNIKFSKY